MIGNVKMYTRIIFMWVVQIKGGKPLIRGEVKTWVC